jgi:outer membrane protein
MKRMLAVLGALATVGMVQAADLLDVYRDAVASDAKFASARAQLDAGREKYPQARAGLLPNVVLSAGTSYTNADITEPLERKLGYNTNSYAVQLTQPLLRWQNWVAARQGELQVGVAEAQFSAALMDLMARTTQAYFDLLFAGDALSAVQTLKAAAAEQLQLATKSFEVGTVTVTDVHEAQSRFDLAVAQEVAAQNDVDVKRQALRLITGQEAGALAPLRTGLALAAPRPASMEEWVSAAEQGNADVQAQQLTTEIASRELERARAGHLPTLDAVASYGHNHGGSSTSGAPSEVRNWAIGLQLSVPLYQGGGIQSRVREALALSDKARADLDSVRRAVALAARQYYLGVTSGIAQVKGYEAALVSSRSALDANKLGYEVGVRINIDVLNAQSQLADTTQKLARARYDAILAQLHLKQAAGTLSVDDLGEINALLQH